MEMVNKGQSHSTMKAAVLLATAAHAAKQAVEEPAESPVAFLIDPVKEMVNKGIETAAGWLKGGPQMVSDVVCGIIDTWVSVIDPNDGTIRKAMSGDAATLDELASLASTIGSIVFVVYVCMTAVNLFLATAESVRDYFKNYLTIPKLSKLVPVVGQYLQAGDAPFATVTGPIQKYVLDPVKNWKHRTILPFEGSHGSTLSGTIATITAATSACLLLSTTPDVLALARGGADKAAAEALAWTVGTALGLKYVAARA